MRNVGAESRNIYEKWTNNGFFEKYMSGIGLDIGYRGYEQDIVPILPEAIGVDSDYPGYDSHRLPFGSETVDYVFASHVLEHITDYSCAIIEWFRVIKHFGHVIITVPHKYLYEKKHNPPSDFNGDHKRFYTPSSLLTEVEKSLDPNTYRVRYCADNDDNFNYSIPPEKHSGGSYQVELILQKIQKPVWDLLT